VVSAEGVATQALCMVAGSGWCGQGAREELCPTPPLLYAAQVLGAEVDSLRAKLASSCPDEQVCRRGRSKRCTWGSAAWHPALVPLRASFAVVQVYM